MNNVKQCKWCGEPITGYVPGYQKYPTYQMGMWDGKTDYCNSICRRKKVLWYECRVIEREKEQRRQRLMPQ